MRNYLRVYHLECQKSVIKCRHHILVTYQLFCKNCSADFGFRYYKMMILQYRYVAFVTFQFKFKSQYFCLIFPEQNQTIHFKYSGTMPKKNKVRKCAVMGCRMRDVSSSRSSKLRFSLHT